MENVRSVGILGLGSCIPQKKLTNLDLEKIMDTSHKWIIERTGIQERCVVDSSENTSDLAVKAAEKAMADAGVAAEELDLILVATISPDMFFPSVSCLVQARLKALNAAAFDISAACSGFIYGLLVGVTFIQSGIYKKILVIGAEALSRFTNYSDRNTAVIFGDGAGAAVIGEVPSGYGILGAHLGADGSGGDFLKIPAGGSRQPASLETVAKNLHYIQMDGNEVFKFATRIVEEAVNKVLEKANLSKHDIDFFVPHQANLRIIQSAAKRLNISMDHVVVNLDKYGNTSAASIPIALDEAVKSRRIKKGDVVMLVGFGAGLTWGASVIKWY